MAIDHHGSQSPATTIMDNQHATVGYVLSYGEMIGDQDELYRQAELTVFDADVGWNLGAGGLFSSPDDAIAAWMEWMSENGYDVVELPRTARTRGWGILFSVMPKDGGESLLYAVTIDECGCCAAG